MSDEVKTCLTQQQLYDTVAELAQVRDDNFRLARGTGKTQAILDAAAIEAFDEVQATANRRGRRTARRSKRRKAWNHQRDHFLNIKPADRGEWASHDQIMLVISPTWIRWMRNYYNIEREL